jgi:hypothetical protein
MILEQDDNRLKILFLLCNRWQERNAVREGERKRLPAYVASLSSNQALQVKSLNKPMQREGGLRNRNRKWLRPEAGRLKINVDGAFRDTDKNGGRGYVIRDDEGRVIQSGSGTQRFAYS